MLVPGTVGADPASIRVGLTRPVDPTAAPIPRHPDEALLFRLLYEPLIRVDCTGRPYPALASSWSGSDDGRRWTFRLREGVRFWDGTSVTADTVATAWQRARAAGRAPWNALAGRVQEVRADDSRTLTVVLSDGHDVVPRFFADPGLALARGTDRAEWPVEGTGRYRVHQVTFDGRGIRSGSRVTAMELEATGATVGPSQITVRVEAGGDARDLLDREVDLLVTGRRGALEYAALRTDLSTHPLPWSRTYVLGVLVDQPELRPPPTAFLASLATDVARVEARPAAAPADSVARCRAVLDTAGPPNSRGVFSGRTAADSVLVGRSSANARIVYPPGDPTARDLAERLVALASAPRGSASAITVAGLRATALDRSPPGLVATPGQPADFPRAFAHVSVVDHRPWTHTPCEQGARRSVPLIDVRERIIARPLHFEIGVDGGGTVVLHPFDPERGSRQ